MTALKLARGATLAFAHVFPAAALAALALFPFEPVALPLLPGIVLALMMRRPARQLRSWAPSAPRAELKELARTSASLALLTLPIAGGDLWFGWSHSGVLVATCGLCGLAILHGTLTLAAFAARPRGARAAVSGPIPCADC